MKADQEHFLLFPSPCQSSIASNLYNSSIILLSSLPHSLAVFPILEILCPFTLLPGKRSEGFDTSAALKKNGHYFVVLLRDYKRNCTPNSFLSPHGLFVVGKEGNKCHWDMSTFLFLFSPRMDLIVIAKGIPKPSLTCIPFAPLPMHTPSSPNTESV